MGNARVLGFKSEPFLVESIHREFRVVKFLIACLHYLDPRMSDLDDKHCSELGYPQFIEATSQPSDLGDWNTNGFVH